VAQEEIARAGALAVAEVLKDDHLGGEVAAVAAWGERRLARELLEEQRRGPILQDRGVFRALDDDTGRGGRGGVQQATAQDCALVAVPRPLGPPRNLPAQRTCQDALRDLDEFFHRASRVTGAP